MVSRSLLFSLPRLALENHAHPLVDVALPPYKESYSRRQSILGGPPLETESRVPSDSHIGYYFLTLKEYGRLSRWWPAIWAELAVNNPNRDSASANLSLPVVIAFLIAWTITLCLSCAGKARSATKSSLFLKKIIDWVGRNSDLSAFTGKPRRWHMLTSILVLRYTLLREQCALSQSSRYRKRIIWCECTHSFTCFTTSVNAHGADIKPNGRTRYIFTPT